LTGIKELVCYGDKPRMIDLAELNLDDKLTSYYCGKDTWYNFCKNANADNSCPGYRLSSGAGHAKNNRLTNGFDN